MIILGINGAISFDSNDNKTYSHGSSVTLVIDGKLISSVTEERLSRIKYDGNYPKLSIEEVLLRNNLKREDIDIVAYVGSCFTLDFEHPLSFLKTNFPKSKIEFVEHHLAHAMSSFLSSDFDECNIFTFDGAGESHDVKTNKDRLYTNSTFWTANKKDFIIHKNHNSYNSNCSEKNIFHYSNLGEFYNDVSMYTIYQKTKNIGHRESAPGKAMGIVAYGNYKNIKAPNPFKILKPTEYDMPVIVSYRAEYLDIVNYFHEKNENDVMAWGQKIFEDTLIEYFKQIPLNIKKTNLCMSGGCSLNILLNSRLIEEGVYEDVHINTAPNDDGLSFGAALYVSRKYENKIDLPINIGCIGLDYSDEKVLKDFQKFQNDFTYEKKSFDEIIEIVSELLIKNEIVAWFQDKSEFGPRALGNRSIFANPTFENKELLNEKIKFRESWRPYAAIIMEEHLNDWFDIPKKNSHYMLFSGKVKNDKLGKIPSVTHVDNTCRVQTVNNLINERSYLLLKQFHKKSAIPLLLNTSFNTLKGEPIVETPKDAFNSVLNSKIDYLVINNFLFKKRKI
jgi:carbamoyltransferase